jgi:hypothetical protein
MVFIFNVFKNIQALTIDLYQTKKFSIIYKDKPIS